MPSREYVVVPQTGHVIRTDGDLRGNGFLSLMSGLYVVVIY